MAMGAGFRVAAVVALSLAAAGCAFLHGKPQPAPTVQAAPAAPELPKPTATHRFEIDADTQVVGYVQRTTVGKDDTFTDLARRFDVGYQEMVLANPGMDPWLPPVGSEVLIPTQFVLPQAPHEGVVVDVAAMRLFYYLPHKKGEPQVLYSYPIGIGRVGWKTREGTTKVVDHTKNPVWVVPPSVRAEHAKDGDPLPATVPPGPDNPLGQYRMRLGWPTYLIHGTNKPAGIGMRVSHGCMHLYPEDIADLFEQVPVGTKVTIVNQPYLFGWRDGQLYFQAYGVMEDDKRDWSKHRERLFAHMVNPQGDKQLAADSAAVDWDKVAELAQAPRAVPVPVMDGSAGLDAVVSNSMLVENTLPQGSNWDGKTELLIDEKTYNELLSGPTTDPAPAAQP